MEDEKINILTDVQSDKNTEEKVEWTVTTDDEERYFEEDVEKTENMKSIDILEICNDEFDFESLLSFLDTIHPNLKEEIAGCSPEMVWFLIKEITGVDINVVKDIYYTYHKEEKEYKERMDFLKRNFIYAINPNCKKHC